jgi:hypothetical protein
VPLDACIDLCGSRDRIEECSCTERRCFEDISSATSIQLATTTTTTTMMAMFIVGAHVSL